MLSRCNSSDITKHSLPSFEHLQLLYCFTIACHSRHIFLIVSDLFDLYECLSLRNIIPIVTTRAKYFPSDISYTFVFNTLKAILSLLFISDKKTVVFI